LHRGATVARDRKQPNLPTRQNFFPPIDDSRRQLVFYIDDTCRQPFEHR